MSKLLKIIALLLLLPFISMQALSVVEINAETNAYRHNNKGLIYLQEKYYYGAIKEFEIAIGILPDKQASAVFYTNLAQTYDKIGYHKKAEPMYEKALSLNGLNASYYINLAESYKKSGTVDEKLKLYKSKKNSPLNQIMTGLLYIQKGDISTGITELDDFCDKEPNLLVTPGIRAYINKIINEKL